jgi:molybdopterin synthase catalytic subunit
MRRMSALRLYEGSLNVEKIFNTWHEEYKTQNFGAFITFVGIVRDEDGIEGLSFDIYEPILSSWFDAWQAKAKEQNALILMAHSRGDVPLHTTSYIAAVLSPKRKVALALINDFVEDFKAKAPIWKYDLRDGKRVYAEDRSTALPSSGLLA